MGSAATGARTEVGHVAQRVGSRLKAVLAGSDLCAVRFTLGYTALVMALALAFAVPSELSSPSQVLGALMPLGCWSMVFTTMGVLQFAVLYRGCLHSRLAVTFAAVSAGVWVFVLAIMLFTSTTSMTAVVSSGIALAAVWVFMRSGYTTRGERHDRGATH